MDIIGHLNRTVSPQILGDDRNDANEGLLKQFYAILLGRLADEDTYDLLSGQEIAHDDLEFFDRVWTQDTHRNSISKELAASYNMDEPSAKNLVTTAAPLVFNELSSLSGSTPVPQFLRDNLSTYREHIPTWATPLIPAGVLVAKPVGERISDTVSTAPLHREKEKGGSFLKALLPIIGLIILGVLAWALLKGCNDKEVVTAPISGTEQTQPVAAEPVVAAPSVEPASLSISSGEGNILYACNANVGTAGLQNDIMGVVSSVFGDESNKCRVDVDDSFAPVMPAADVLAEVLQLIKETPNASVIFKGETIALNANDPEVLAQLLESVKSAAPNLNVIAEGPLDIQNEIDNSLTAAGTAMDSLNNQSDPRDVARALSLQVINFELDKSFIPEVNKPLLQRAAQLIQEVPNLKLVIIGHTDALASDAYNMDLSRDRANSVKDFLVEHGVDPDKLVTKGKGESEPIATNETERGRFRNRRIEFVVYDESMDSNDNGISVVQDANIVIDPDSNSLNENNIDPDLNPLDENNDDVLPDADDVILNNIVN